MTHNLLWIDPPVKAKLWLIPYFFVWFFPPDCWMLVEFLNIQLSFFVSIIWQCCVNCSIKAVVIFSSLKTLDHSAQLWLIAIIILAYLCSLLLLFRFGYRGSTTPLAIYLRTALQEIPFFWLSLEYWSRYGDTAALWYLTMPPISPLSSPADLSTGQDYSLADFRWKYGAGGGHKVTFRYNLKK